jgi:ABC-type transport system involved in multi-copper enzyme maturation permease subunit
VTWVRRFFSFPLLAKELTETAARRRTYVVRFVYAALLFAFFALITPRWVWRTNASAYAAMGEGRRMFTAILVLQFFGIALFLPAMMCGRITSEKERDSLVLLFLTELRPWKIVIEKYIGGLVPMLSFLLLAMPLAAIAYAFGGVAPEQLAAGIYVLLLGALQVGAIALACSAWFRTTVGAFVGTYIFGALFYLGPVLALALFRMATRWDLGPGPDDVFFIHFPPALMDYADSRSSENIVVCSLPAVASIIVFLTLARVFLVRRAFLPESQFFRRMFRGIDGFMQRINRITGHRLILKPSGDLPGDAPIAWREMSRKSMGKAHHLIRILVAIEIPVVALCIVCAVGGANYSGQVEGLTALAAVVGVVTVLALSVQAANTIVSERVQQTIEVLLTTPLTGREIVLQKARALRRFMLVLAVPLITIFGVECYTEADLGRKDTDGGFVTYAVCAAVTLAIYFPLVSWLSLWIGLKMRTRFKAIIAAIATIVGWNALPFLAAILSISWLREFGINVNRLMSFMFASPIMIVALNEMAELHEYANMYNQSGAWAFILVNSLFYGAILLFLRHHALKHADTWLRR